ncbi:MAG: DUF2854 domain-containing protein [Cyanobacteria bacterium P01_H01_bin.15]
MFAKVSLGSVLLTVGGILTITGFYAYFSGNATLNLAGLFYGVPILLGGFALRAAELKPTPFTAETTPEILALREAQATDTQNQIRKDVTRYRYGQEVHLEESLERLNMSPTDEERPLLIGLRETSTDGAYTLVLEFDSPLMPMNIWEDRKERLTRFFGPDIRIDLTEDKDDDRVDVALIKTQSAPAEASAA